MGWGVEQAKFMEDLTGGIYRPSSKLTTLVNQWLSLMSDEERFIVKMKWGLNNSPKLKITELVEKLNENFGCGDKIITTTQVRAHLNKLREDFYRGALNCYELSCVVREIENQESNNLEEE